MISARISSVRPDKGLKVLQIPTRYLALILVALAGCFLQTALAEISIVDEDHYDGSEFKVSSYTDPSFDKPTFREGSTKKLFHFEPIAQQNESKSPKKRSEEMGVSATGGSEKKLTWENARDSLTAAQIQPVHDLPGDWVPDRINLTSNGGFTIAPENGAPVPYTLNGHVDIQRGVP